jgi:hypothetical protein
MSDTLLDYAQPFIDRVPHDHGPEELRKALLIASGVWNAVVAERGDIDRAVAFVARILTEESQKPLPRELLVAIGALAVRKLAQFCYDDRIVVGVKVYRAGDELRVLAAWRPAR